MRFNCGLSRAEKAKRRHAKLLDWHLKFAWMPVRIKDKCCWLEFVSRKGIYVNSCFAKCWIWEYDFACWYY